MKLRIVVLLIACVGLGFYIQQLGAAQGLPAAKPNQTKSIDYIKENWSLEVTKGMFGTRLSEHPGAVPASTNPSDDSMNKLVWYSTDASSNYGNQFPGRSVLYGFKDGKMAAVCLLTGMAWDNDEEKARAKKQWIANLYTNFNKLSGTRLTFEDSELRLDYTSYCHPGENIFGRIIVKSSETK